MPGLSFVCLRRLLRKVSYIRVLGHFARVMYASDREQNLSFSAGTPTGLTTGSGAAGFSVIVWYMLARASGNYFICVHRYFISLLFRFSSCPVSRVCVL